MRTLALTQLESVGLWAGILAGVISIVLAVVAIVFTAAIDKRSRDVTVQMIKSLQKIESTVERVSGDTVDLIKVAWERMLPPATPASSDTAVDAANTKSIAAGIAAELRADLSNPEEQAPADGGAAVVDRLEGLTERLEQALTAQATNATGSSESRMNLVMKNLSTLSPTARELARQLSAGGHLTRKQFTLLRSTPLVGAVAELRAAGLLAPLQGRSEDGKPEPVYWFPPSTSRYVKAGLRLVAQDDDHRPLLDEVAKQLAGVGYPQAWLAERQRRLEQDGD